ncbi:DNA polymerase IV [Youxingia wuxianensis]|uniref:DNA polymerase IV n=1 Tax=Youxingia wuxianensis TaxID=2763678 RepID=A0A926EMT3_9FIRM|nr:DNA polymerase IV [Youxingia wuxianensis]MBC8585476.1 DNA polymerase IV [Youxingia wuxianensis]
MDRTILHCDCNGFYASVECAMHPEYKNVPMAVCGDPQNRHGIILAKNELAKKYNVQTAETIWQAKRKCPDLVLAAAHHREYQRYSRMINAIYQRFTDRVEPFSIDESWLDVTGCQNLFGDGKQIADTLRNTIREELGITISAGVSFNKIYAKLGSDYKKPDATTVITRGNYQELLFPLPVSALMYVGRSAREQLDKLYIKTIGDLARSDKRLIAGKLGKVGELIHDYANGIDDSPVASIYEQREIKSVGNGITFRRNLTGIEDIRLGVRALCDTVAGRLRKHGLKCQTLQVTIKDPQFKVITRQRPLPFPTNLSQELIDLSLEIVSSSWRIGAPIRMLAITGSGLIPADQVEEQLSFYTNPDAPARKKQEKLENAMDIIREKYGQGAISFGTVIHNDLGIEKDD